MPDGIVEQPMPPQSEQKGTLGAKPPQEKLQPQNTLNNNEWQRLLELGKKSPLDLTDGEFDEVRKLSTRGRALLGDKFNEELTKKKLAAQEEQRRIAREKHLDLVSKIDTIGKDLTNQMRQVVDDFAVRQTVGQAKLDKKERDIREEMEALRKKDKPQNPADALSKLENDPAIKQAKTKIIWSQALAGQEVSGLDPKLREEILRLKRDAVTMIFKDPNEYQREFDALKLRFFQSQGVETAQKTNQ